MNVNWKNFTVATAPQITHVHEGVTGGRDPREGDPSISTRPWHRAGALASPSSTHGPIPSGSAPHPDGSVSDDADRSDQLTCASARPRPAPPPPPGPPRRRPTRLDYCCPAPALLRLLLGC